MMLSAVALSCAACDRATSQVEEASDATVAHADAAAQEASRTAPPDAGVATAVPANSSSGVPAQAIDAGRADGSARDASPSKGK